MMILLMMRNNTPCNCLRYLLPLVFRIPAVGFWGSNTSWRVFWSLGSIQVFSDSKYKLVTARVPNDWSRFDQKKAHGTILYLPYYIYPTKKGPAVFVHVGFLNRPNGAMESHGNSFFFPNKSSCVTREFPRTTSVYKRPKPSTRIVSLWMRTEMELERSEKRATLKRQHPCFFGGIPSLAEDDEDGLFWT